MHSKALILIVVASLAISACATKRYPIATRLTAAEVAAMDCRELNLELARAEQVRLQIAETGETDWRSAAGFLGDFGIGNAMARSEAEAAVQQRITDIRAAEAQKGCGQ
jgi:hypothetical protein